MAVEPIARSKTLRIEFRFLDRLFVDALCRLIRSVRESVVGETDSL